MNYFQKGDIVKVKENPYNLRVGSFWEITHVDEFVKNHYSISNYTHGGGPGWKRINGVYSKYFVLMKSKENNNNDIEWWDSKNENMENENFHIGNIVKIKNDKHNRVWEIVGIEEFRNGFIEYKLILLNDEPNTRTTDWVGMNDVELCELSKEIQNEIEWWSSENENVENENFYIGDKVKIKNDKFDNRIWEIIKVEEYPSSNFAYKLLLLNDFSGIRTVVWKAKNQLKLYQPEDKDDIEWWDSNEKLTLKYNKFINDTQF